MTFSKNFWVWLSLLEEEEVVVVGDAGAEVEEVVEVEKERDLVFRGAIEDMLVFWFWFWFLESELDILDIWQLEIVGSRW